MRKTVFKTGAELFPELGDTNNYNRYIDFIKIEDMKSFVNKCHEHTGKQNLIYENKVAEILIDHLIKKELLDENNHQTFVDVLLVACFLHNIYFDEKNIATSLMMTRQELDPIADEFDLPEQVREAIWDGIEGQLGDATPMQKTKPSPNTPQDLLAECIYIVRNSNRWFHQ